MRWHQVTLLPEVCTGALCAHCKEHKENLLKCSRCKRAWYCSKEHQKEHWPEHKSTCRAAAPFVDALIDVVTEKQPQSYEQMQRLIVGATLLVQRSNMLTPEQRSNVFNCVNNTVFCRVCFKLREQLPPSGRFVCCPKCLWGWCCQEHWQQFEPQHQPSCAEYATMQRLGIQTRQQASAGFLQACNQLPYPMGKVPALQQVQCMQDWARYRRLRVPSITNEDTWRCMTDDMAVPLTTVWATLLMYSKQQLAGLQEFNLHLVGASHYEFEHVLANTAIEEVLHLLSPVKTLRVMLIGPDWKRIAPGPSCTTHDKEVCPPCTRIHAKRILSIYRGTYEEFARSKEWTNPTLALACNSGVGCEDEESWGRAVKVLLDKNIPSCFTSMNASELELDSVALRKAGAHLLYQGCNTFGSLVPLRDLDSAPDEFYYLNGWAICFKGRGPAAAGGS